MKLDRMLTTLLVAIVLLGAVVLLAAPGGEVVASPSQQVADCTASGSGSMENLGSLDVRFSCSTAQQVYFGVCDPRSLMAEFEMVYQDAVVASNSFDLQQEGSSQFVSVGWADAQAGLNLATLNSTNTAEVYEYLYAISPVWSDVATAMQQNCSAIITTVPPASETVLFEKTLEGVFNGDVLNLQGIIDQDYAQVIFRARWPGSTGTLTVFPPSGGAITEDDPGVSHATGPGIDEWTVENSEQGQWTLQFEAETEFFGETVVLGAYTTGAPLPAGQSGGSIRGLVFEDTDGDGRHDPGESGMAGVQVVFSSTGDWQMTFESGSDGTFGPAGLTRAYYTASLVVPEGYVATGPTRYEEIDVGYTGRLALGVDFGLREAVVPSALPATGAGPGALMLWVVLGVALLGGATLLWRPRRDLQ